MHCPSHTSHIASHVNHAPQWAVEHALPISCVPRCLPRKPCPTTGGQARTTHLAHPMLPPTSPLCKPYPTTGSQARTARLVHPTLPLTSPLHKPHPTMGSRACTTHLTCPHPSLNSRVCKIKYISNIYCC